MSAPSGSGIETEVASMVRRARVSITSPVSRWTRTGAVSFIRRSWGAHVMLTIPGTGTTLRSCQRVEERLGLGIAGIEQINRQLIEGDLTAGAEAHRHPDSA